MKKINLILQSKGGVGKSFLTWLINQKTKQESVLFVDADQKTRTTYNRMGADRCKAFELLDSSMKIDREQFLNLLEWASQQPYENVYVDFGAPESIELVHAFEINYNVKQVKELLEQIGLDLHFNVVLSGGDTLAACLQYFTELVKAVDMHYPVTVWLNRGRFSNDDQAVIDSIQKNGEAHGYEVKNFGSTAGETSDERLLLTMSNGNDVDQDTLNLATKLKFKKLMDEIVL